MNLVKKPRLICVTGIDGSGKSTLIKKLKATLANSEIVTIWDILRKPDLRDCFHFKSKEDIDRYLALLHHPARAMFLFHCLAEAMNLACKEAETKGTEVLLLDGYWFKYAASEIAFGADCEEVVRLASVFPEPEIVFYLELEASVALSRKKTFSGYEGGYDPEHSEQGFVNFQNRSNQMINELIKKQNFRKIEGLADPEAKLQACLKELS